MMTTNVLAVEVIKLSEDELCGLNPQEMLKGDEAIDLGWSYLRQCNLYITEDENHKF